MDSLRRHTDLIESGKSTATLLELRILRDKAESHFKDMNDQISDLEKARQLKALAEKLNASDAGLEQELARKQRQGTHSGEWILCNDQFKSWSDSDTIEDSVLYIHGIPGAGESLKSRRMKQIQGRIRLTSSKGKTILASFIIEKLQERGRGSVLFFYCKHDRPGKQTFTDILRGLLVQVAREDNVLASCLYEKCASLSETGVTTILEKLATIAFESQTRSFVVLDGLDECGVQEAEKTISWFISLLKDTLKPDCGQVRLLCVGQRTEALQRMLVSTKNISLETTSHQTDIADYVRARAQGIRDEFDISSQVESEIITRITKGAKSKLRFLYSLIMGLSRRR